MPPVLRDPAQRHTGMGTPFVYAPYVYWKSGHTGMLHWCCTQTDVELRNEVKSLYFIRV